MRLSPAGPDSPETHPVRGTLGTNQDAFRRFGFAALSRLDFVMGCLGLRTLTTTLAPLRPISAWSRVSESPTSIRLDAPSQEHRDASDRLLPPTSQSLRPAPALSTLVVPWSRPKLGWLRGIGRLSRRLDPPDGIAGKSRRGVGPPLPKTIYAWDVTSPSRSAAPPIACGNSLRS